MTSQPNSSPSNSAQPHSSPAESAQPNSAQPNSAQPNSAPASSPPPGSSPAGSSQPNAAPANAQLKSAPPQPAKPSKPWRQRSLQRLRQLHASLAPVVILPLLVTIATGVTYRIGKDWFGLTRDQVHFLMVIHEGEYWGKTLEPVYVLLNGLGLLWMLGTGTAMLLQKWQRSPRSTPAAPALAVTSGVTPAASAPPPLGDSTPAPAATQPEPAPESPNSADDA